MIAGLMFGLGLAVAALLVVAASLVANPARHAAPTDPKEALPQE